MQIKNITIKEKDEFNSLATHPLQSYEWGEFREKIGVKVIRKGFYENGKIVAGFQITIHKIPHTPWTIGYVPKGSFPAKPGTRLYPARPGADWYPEELVKIGKENKCIFIQLEPNIKNDTKILRYKDIKRGNDSSYFTPNILVSQYHNIWPSAHPLFTKYTFQLDLTKSEDELLKNMHPKTRYNIRMAQKHGVMVKEEISDKAFEDYLKLIKETTTRQGFYAHTEKYHRLMWETLGRQQATGNRQQEENKLTAHLLVAYYKNIPLTTWILFVFHDILYYPYGASSNEHKEVMASNLMMWEAIKFGKKLGLKTFDMWGSLGENPDPKNPWYGFHRFKMGYGPRLVEFVGSYDLVIHPFAYQVYKLADKLRWIVLRVKNKLN